MTENGDQQAAIVTGGARRIGAAIVRSLHGRGLNLVIHCRDTGAIARDLAEDLNAGRPDSVTVIEADLSDTRAPAAIVACALKAFGRLDVLVNNASEFHPTPVTRADQEDWDTLINSNLRGPYFLSKKAAPALARSGGSIVNLADIHGLVPLKGHGIYSQAKAGLIMQTKALARDLAPDIRVNAVAPGTILWPEGDRAPSETSRAAIVAKVPLGRQGTPEDIAGAVVFLALDAPYITGQVLAVDGGRLLNM